MWAETTIKAFDTILYNVTVSSSCRRIHLIVKVPLSTSGKIVKKFYGQREKILEDIWCESDWCPSKDEWHFM